MRVIAGSSYAFLIDSAFRSLGTFAIAEQAADRTQNTKIVPASAPTSSLDLLAYNPFRNGGSFALLAAEGDPDAGNLLSAALNRVFDQPLDLVIITAEFWNKAGDVVPPIEYIKRSPLRKFDLSGR